MQKQAVTMIKVTDGFTHTANDRVPLADVDAYVADARTRWDFVIPGEIADDTEE